MMVLLYSVLWGAGGALGLWGLYRALQLNWPEQYASLNDTFALRINQSAPRFFLYRFVPIFGAGIAVWATTFRLHLDPAVSVITMSLVHVLFTNGNALVRTFGDRRPSHTFSVNFASAHLIAVAVVGAATAAAIFLGPALTVLVPRPRVLLENLWIAIFVAVVGGIAVSVIGRRPDGALPYSGEYFVWRARRDIGDELIDFAYDAAIQNRVDPLLLWSVMFAEALQRPRWVRNIERVKGLLFKKGTYGVTQELADRPISDLDAISRTAEALAGCWVIVPNEYGLAGDDGLIWKYASQHNRDGRFVEGVRQIYSYLEWASTPLYQVFTQNGLKVIEVRRFGDQFGLRAATTEDRLQFRFTSASGRQGEYVVERPVDVIQPRLWSFELRFDSDVSSFELTIDGSRGRGVLDVPIVAASESRNDPRG